MGWQAPTNVVTGNYCTVGLWNQTIVDNPIFLYGRLPQTTFIFWDEASGIFGGAATRVYVIDNAQAFNHITQQSGNGFLGDYQQLSIWLKEGTYSVYWLGRSGPDCGIITWTLDSSTIDTQDWYSASTTRNVIKSLANLTITGSGRHILKGTISGKHASATAYHMPLTATWFIASSYSVEVE